MSREQAITHWTTQFFRWSTVLTEPSTNASSSAQEIIRNDEEILEMAETMVDGLLQGGYAPTQVAIAIAQAGVLTISRLIRQYEIEFP